ncbi:MAG: putative quinol monooxygenase [Pirellulales bacterium]|jgi:quinol monooxygenase YgiN
MNFKLNFLLFALCTLFICSAAEVNGAEKSKHPNHVYWIIETSVKDGELKNLKALNAEMVKATKANEPGTLGYDWSISADGKTCFFFERYADSDAVMIHTKTFGEKYAERLMTMIEIKSFHVFGKPNDEVKKGLSNFGANFHQSIGGFTK